MLIGSVAAPAALVVLGIVIATVPSGEVGVPPLAGKSIVVTGSGLPKPSTLTEVPFAVA